MPGAGQVLRTKRGFILTCTCFFCIMQQIEIITEELIISKADVDYSTDPDKRQHCEILESQLRELLR